MGENRLGPNELSIEIDGQGCWKYLFPYWKRNIIWQIFYIYIVSMNLMEVVEGGT